MQPDQTPLPPTDLSVSGIVNWALGILVAVVAYLWRQNEGKNTKAIELLDARLLLADQRLVASDAKHEDCQKDRAKQSVDLATLSERLNQLEKQFVHTASK